MYTRLHIKFIITVRSMTCRVVEPQMISHFIHFAYIYMIITFIDNGSANENKYIG